MIINYDRSRVTVSDKELMRHGYAEEDYHSIRLSFEYTEQQKQENRMRAESCDNAKWSEICKDSALMRSRYMERVIDKIVSAFPYITFLRMMCHTIVMVGIYTFGAMISLIPVPVLDYAGMTTLT